MPSLTAVGFALLINGLALSLFFSPGSSDVQIWGNWMREISAYGLTGGYTHSDTDYPPLAFLILAAVLKCAAAFGASEFVLLKCSLFVFLLATATCFYWFTRDLILTAALELVLTLNSIALGYLDIYFAPFLIAGFFLLQRGHVRLGLLLFVISCVIKWQPLIIAPFVCLYVFENPKGHPAGKAPQFKSQIVPFILAASIVGVPLFLIFGWKIFNSLHRAMTYHIFLSAYGLNFSWIHTWILHLVQPEKYGALQSGMIDIFQTRDPWVIWPEKSFFYLSYTIVFIAFLRQRKTFQRLIVYSILGYLAYFIFNTSVHENHLFLICCLAWILVFLEPSELIRCLNLSLAANLNLFLFYGAFGRRLNPVIGGIDVTVLFAVANVCLFAGFLFHTLRKDGLDLVLLKIPPRSNETGQPSTTSSGS